MNFSPIIKIPGGIFILFHVLYFMSHEFYISPMLLKSVIDKSGIKATKMAIPISSAAFVSSALAAHSGQSCPLHGSGVCAESCTGVCVSSIFLFSHF
jgi:hypothetical protein